MPFIDFCIESNCSISTICERLGATPNALRQRFIKDFGLTPKTWIQQNRVVFTVRMLRLGEKMPAIIAKLGYVDYSHLAKDVKAMLGKTPRAIANEIEARQAEAYVTLSDN